MKGGTVVWGSTAWILQEVWWDDDDGPNRFNKPFSVFELLYPSLTRSDILLSKNTYHIQCSGPTALSYRTSWLFPFRLHWLAYDFCIILCYVCFQPFTGKFLEGMSITFSPWQTGIWKHCSVVTICFKSMRWVGILWTNGRWLFN